MFSSLFARHLYQGRSEVHGIKNQRGVIGTMRVATGITVLGLGISSFLFFVLLVCLFVFVFFGPKFVMLWHSKITTLSINMGSAVKSNGSSLPC